MKYLSHYTEARQTEIFEQYGAFFAFSNKQFEEKAVDGVTYCQLGAGLICPKDNARDIVDALEQCQKDGIAQDVAENGIPAIILRELCNHECFYTGEIDDACDALEQYGIKPDQVLAVYRENYAEQVENL